MEVHPNFSDAPRLRSSIPHPETDFSQNQNASRRIIPRPKSAKRFFFEIKIGISDDSSSRNPVFQKQNSGNVLPLS